MQQLKGKKDFTAVFGQSKNNKTFLQLLTNIMHKNQWYMLHKKEYSQIYCNQDNTSKQI